MPSEVKSELGSSSRLSRCASVSPRCLARSAVVSQRQLLRAHRLSSAGARSSRRATQTVLRVLAVAQKDVPSTAAKEVDLVLSSGFLAFANHCGFLQAIDQRPELRVRGVMGTSAGALAGSLYCAGYDPAQVAREVSLVPPYQLLQPCWTPWKGGVLSLNRVVRRLRDLLPATFEELEVEFAVGVAGRDGSYRVVDSGPLPEAVAASAAIPVIFSAVNVDGSLPYVDGGVVDRVGLKGWRDRRRRQLGAADSRVLGLKQSPPAVVHLIGRSSPFSGADDVLATGEQQVTVIRSPKSGVSFFDLGDFEGQMSAARERALPAVAKLADGASGRALYNSTTR